MEETMVKIPQNELAGSFLTEDVLDVLNNFTKIHPSFRVVSSDYFTTVKGDKTFAAYYNMSTKSFKLPRMCFYNLKEFLDMLKFYDLKETQITFKENCVELNDDVQYYRYVFASEKTIAPPPTLEKFKELAEGMEIGFTLTKEQLAKIIKAGASSMKCETVTFRYDEKLQKIVVELKNNDVKANNLYTLKLNSDVTFMSEASTYEITVAFSSLNLLIASDYKVEFQSKVKSRFSTKEDLLQYIVAAAIDDGE